MTTHKIKTAAQMVRDAVAGLSPVETISIVEAIAKEKFVSPLDETTLHNLAHKLSRHADEIARTPR